MKILTITAPDEAVTIALIDPENGATIVERALAPGEAHVFAVTDGVLIQQIDELTSAAATDPDT